jgi:hypothetical protein
VTAAALALVALAVVTGLLFARGGNPLWTQFSGVGHESSSHVLTSQDVLIVASPSRGGFRVTVVLKHPATAVVASVNGQLVNLHPSSVSGHLKMAFSGNDTQSLPVPSAWLLPHDGVVTVRLRINYADGSLIRTEFREVFRHGLGAAYPAASVPA